MAWHSILRFVAGPPLDQCLSSHLSHVHHLHSLASMRPLSSSAGTALRAWTKHSLTSTSRVTIPSITATSQQRRQQSGEVSFDSPFQSGPSTTKIPNFKPYMSGSSETSNRVFQYFMVGTMGLLAAAGAKATVQGMDTQDPRS